ncbi:MAG: hypothetical protein RI946_927 [Pseudomonadota bacterium]
MDNMASSRVWWFRVLFVIVAMGLMFFRLLPLDTRPQNWAGPDILMAFIFAWSVRRPAAIPSILIALVIFSEDLVLQREPGLQAALVIIAAAWLKLSLSYNSDASALREWMLVAAAVVGVTVATRFILIVFFVPLPGLGLHLSQMVATILIYPVVAAVTHFVFGLRPVTAQSGEFGTLRGRS